MLNLNAGPRRAAHLFWMVERNANRNVNRDYGDGVFKGMWIGIATGPRGHLFWSSSSTSRGLTDHS
jgi:hypothetical protein